MSDKEIRDQVVNLINGDETTHPVMAWAIYGLLTTCGCGSAPRRKFVKS